MGEEADYLDDTADYEAHNSMMRNGYMFCPRANGYVSASVCDDCDDDCLE
jgi:hypothetical protein